MVERASIVNCTCRSDWRRSRRGIGRADVTRALRAHAGLGLYTNAASACEPGPPAPIRLASARVKWRLPSPSYFKLL